MYSGLEFDQDELASAMRKAYADIHKFIVTEEFRSMCEELMGLPLADRPAFVTRIILNNNELVRRGITVPEGILIQASAFGDRRPTLFVVKKFLPPKYHVVWENVNFTVNNPFNEDDVPSTPEASWRPPLPVALQNKLMSEGADLQAASFDSSTVNMVCNI